MVPLKNIETKDLLAELQSRITEPSVNLPYEIFLFCSRNMTTVNVDILVRNKENTKILLAWRNDEVHGKGWHVPGRIIRFGKSVDEALRDCAEIELGVRLDTPFKLVNIKQILSGEHSNGERGSQVSLLHETLIDEASYPDRPGEIEWFSSVPEQVLEVHKKLVGDLFA